MLARTALHPCRASAAPLTIRATPLSVVRTNSTVAATEPAQEEQPPPPIPPPRKSKIPLAHDFGDFIIPDRDAAKQFARGRESSVGSHRLSQDQFAGQGGLASQLIKRRATQFAQASSINAGSTGRVTPPKIEEVRAKGKALQEEREKTRKAKQEEKTKVQRVSTKTNFAELFSAPTSASSQVVSLNLAQSNGEVSSRAQRVLERTVGEYSRYLPPILGSTPGETMKRAGVVGYARLALARARGATPRQRQNALVIVSRLVGSEPRISKTVHAS